MFDKARTKGHVDLVMKRYDGRTTPQPKLRTFTKNAQARLGGKKCKQLEKAAKNKREANRVKAAARLSGIDQRHCAIAKNAPGGTD